MPVDRRTRRLRRAEEEVALAVAAMDRHGLLPAEHSAGHVTEQSPERSPGRSPGLPADRPGASPSARPAPRRRPPVRRPVHHPGRLVLAGCAAAALVGVLVVQPWTDPASPAPLAYSLLPALPPDEGWGASSLTGSADSAAASGSAESAAASSESANDAVSAQSLTAEAPDALTSLAAAAAERSAYSASLAAAAPEVVVALSWDAAAAAGAGDDVVPDLVVTRTDVTGAVTTTAPASPLTADGTITPAVLASASRAAEAPGGAPEDAEVASSAGPDPTALPRDPAALRAALLASTPCTAPDETACLVVAVGALAAHRVVPADLTAALWQVLALEPDVQDLGTTQDRAGRPAVALAAPAAAPDGDGDLRTWAVLADPVTGAVLGTEVFDAPEDGTGERVVVAFDAVIVPAPG